MLVTMGMLGLILQGFSVEVGLRPSRYLVSLAVSCLFLGLIALGGLWPAPKPERFSKPLSICWLGVTGSTLLTCAVFPRKTYVAALLLWLVVYPFLYLIWNGRRFERMPRLLVQAVSVAYAICIAVCVFFYPVTDFAYRGFFINRNTLGSFCAAAFACFLVYMLAVEHRSLWILAADIGLGSCFAVTYYSSSRSGMLAMASCLAACGVLLLFLQKQQRRRVLLKLLTTVITIMILLPTMIYVFYGGAAVTNHIRSLTEPADSSPSEEIGPSVSEVMEAVEDFNHQKFLTDEKTLNDITSGRIEIWTAFGREVGLLGNPPEKVVYDFSGKPITIGAHFTILQMAYEKGILAGVFFLLFNILSGLKSIQYAAAHRGKAWALFPFAVTITYGVISVLENLSDPIGSPLTILYFLIQAPLLLRPAPMEELEEPA